MQLLRAAGHRAMPWKNGRGVTREVAAEALAGDPQGRSLWRISMATVEGRSDFSRFPGIDRTIAVLSGTGMRMTVEGAAQPEMRALSEPFEFSGDVAVSAECLDGAIVDLNAMTLRGHARHRMRRVAVAGELKLTTEDEVSALVFTGPCRVTAGGAEFSAQVEDVLCPVPRATELTLEPDGPTVVYLIGIETAPGA